MLPKCRQQSCSLEVPTLFADTSCTVCCDVGAARIRVWGSSAALHHALSKHPRSPDRHPEAQSQPVVFTDTTPVLNVEMWDPAMRGFTVLPAIAVPRNYHSVGILLPDGRVFSGGGGLCQQGPCSCAPPDDHLSPVRPRAPRAIAWARHPQMQRKRCQCCAGLMLGSSRGARI